ncbi:hypothetical protein ABIB08_005566 [Bradyrhizobium sp. RT11b]
MRRKRPSRRRSVNVVSRRSKGAGCVGQGPARTREADCRHPGPDGGCRKKIAERGRPLGQGETATRRSSPASPRLMEAGNGWWPSFGCDCLRPTLKPLEETTRLPNHPGAGPTRIFEIFSFLYLKQKTVLLIHLAPPWRWLPRCLLGRGIQTGTGRVRCLIPILLLGGFGYAHLRLLSPLPIDHRFRSPV